MFNGKTDKGAITEAETNNSQIHAPSINLPKGGGAIRGIGEKFATNPVTGSGSMAIPIATSPGRSGFGPQLSLSYDSGSGNGPFGFGWSLSLSSITRKTDKGLPWYDDANESDVFILSGAEDLVPVLGPDQMPPYIPGRAIEAESDGTIKIGTYAVKRYRPRTEGLFARIERWTKKDDPSDVHWRSISKDNILTLYGKDENSRIVNPNDSSRIFSWLICETRDDKGNAILYEYKSDDGSGIDLSQACERNRGGRSDLRRATNRYLKRIFYGNRRSLLHDTSSQRPPFLTQDKLEATEWMFEVVFDYADHDPVSPTPRDNEARDSAGVLKYPWKYRQDPFSSYRAGFEVRTTRLCQRVLMFHHIPDISSAEKGYDGLVRSIDFGYSCEKYPPDVRNPVYTFLNSVTQNGYSPRPDNAYFKKSLPPVEFTYSPVMVQDSVEEVDPASLENLPIGVDGLHYQWNDLHGEGIPGILAEQAGAWFYKRNISPISEDPIEFAAMESVALKPNLDLASGAQFMDLSGDGLPDLVVMDGLMPGLYAHDDAEGWHSFRPFTSRLNRDMRDPNLKFIDLDGDGHADVLISEDTAFVWHASLAEEGFGPACRVAQALDEELGPRLVFADGTQSIYLADLSGDGLIDLVRIRNGEVCYWPNLGYCRFGAKVTMDNSPWFDNPDQFDQKRIRLADIDGSGTTDIIYLHREGVRLYFNQSGNSWAAPKALHAFPGIDDLAAILVADLLGKGTACLVWSSALPGDARRPMRYVNLIGDKKPHLLEYTRNNLGAETSIEYAPSTKFYLQDKRDGKPWITRLPFPVHVVERVTVKDNWRQTEFSTTCSYHQGYFDGIEREFRGFGRVEKIDVESFDKFMAGNVASPFIADDHTLYQPPVKTVTWYHTGVFINRKQILSYLSHEYFAVPGFSEHALPEPTLEEADLTTEEAREALRACKGMMLRQEVFELDVDELLLGKQVPVRLFSTAFHNSDIRLIQPKATNRHAVYHVTESETITYHYELDLRPATVIPDPRVAHTLNLKIDDYGNVLESAAAVYPRINRYEDSFPTPDQLELIHQVQNDESHLVLNCNRFTQDIIGPYDYRLRLPCQSQTWEVTGIAPAGRYFTLKELQEKALAGDAVQEIGYHKIADRAIPQKRLVECARTLFFNDDLKTALPFGCHGVKGMSYESYKLAITKDLLQGVFTDAAKRDKALGALSETTPDGFPKSGYRKGEQLFPNDPVTPTPLADQWWVGSGIAGFMADAAQHFYLPERYTDPFGNTTTLQYDQRDLYIQASTDPMGNTVRVGTFDCRVLATREMIDVNSNHTEVWLDALGMVVASAVKGKLINNRWQGGNLDGFTDELANPPPGRVADFCMKSTLDEAQARTWLGNADVRFVYHFGERLDPDGKIIWNKRMAGACGIAREKHVGQMSPDEVSPLQVFLECSDGTGDVLMKKVQAEPESTGGPSRWIVNGLTVLNNKGKAVKQYEPDFSPAFGCELPQANGVTPVMYYDALGRLIRTELPDGTLSRVEISPWHVKSFDPNDTVKESLWYRERLTTVERAEETSEGSADEEDKATHASPAEKRSARLAAFHADTPSLTFLDGLGREVIAIAHNRQPSQAAEYNNVPYIDRPWPDEPYLTFTKLDAEGKPLWIRDARGNLVMQYIHPVKPTRKIDEPEQDNTEAIPADSVPCYDIAGNLLFQHSMDAGDSWTLNDATGKPMFGWQANNSTDENGTPVDEERVFHTAYDALHRPKEQWLTIDNQAPQLIELFLYGESIENKEQARMLNLRGQLYKHFDQSGLKTVAEIDFQGNAKELHRQLASSYKAQVIGWQEGSPTAGLEGETFVQKSEYDALNRMTRLFNWHRGPGSRVALYEPAYNQRGLLASEVLVVRAIKAEKGGEEEREVDEKGYEEGEDTRRTTPIQEIRYNARGQRELLKLGNGTLTQYDYNRKTFRLQQIRTTWLADHGDFPSCRSNLKDPHVAQQLLYTYDPAGNITEVEDQAYKPVFFKNGLAEPKSLYEYDALYHLISAVGRETAQGGGAAMDGDEPEYGAGFPITDQTLRRYWQYYTYDQVGNISTVRHVANGDGWTRRYGYAPESNRLSGICRGGDTLKAIQYQYDKRGNMQNLGKVGPEYYLSWDYRDMIRYINRGGGGRVYYNYDSGRERTRKVCENNNGEKQWERINFGGLEIYRTFNGTKSKEVESIHLIDGEQRLLLVEDVSRRGDNGPATDLLFRYQYSNHLGSAVLELNEQAKIISYEEYHPYGTSAYRAVHADLRAELKRYRFTGKEWDEESGLHYHGARYYAPWLGRWICCDPLGIADGVGLYIYAKNCPITITDPSGTQSQYYTPDSQQVRGQLNNVVSLTDAKGIEAGIKQSPKGTEVSLVTGGSKSLPHRGDNVLLAHSHVPEIDPTSTPSIRHGADMDVLRSQVKEFKGAVPREHAIYSPNERTYIKISTSGNAAKVVTFKPDGKVVIERITHDPNPATNELAGATKWKSSGSKQLGRVGAGIERARAVASSPLGEFAAQSGAGRGTALLSLARRGVEVGVRTGLGILAAGGSFAGGVQIGTGINQISEGKTIEGAVSVGEGAANLGLSIGTVVLIKSGALIVEGGIAAGSLATAAGLAAGASVILVAETVRAAVKGAETPIDVADKYYGTHFGNIYGWVTGAYSKK